MSAIEMDWEILYWVLNEELGDQLLQILSMPFKQGAIEYLNTSNSKNTYLEHSTNSSRNELGTFRFDPELLAGGSAIDLHCQLRAWYSDHLKAMEHHVKYHGFMEPSMRICADGINTRIRSVIRQLTYHIKKEKCFPIDIVLYAPA